ncbi:energy-coupled thiamine transporter ThiT [Salimicrobium halophilum]|uniref:Thiamine transporter n=1 Tax=Salimicrobium halophilum TaxID=86666 RepID=A0A1G8RLK6_9BACI|nr:energy-coupled thiamine transporter ThiT [Salimicrobium halophilum]SDJ17878.1 thiamine transporter [Salimicrobium halophilum]
MQQQRVLFLVEAAIFSAIALLLDILPFLSINLWFQGGSISFAMIPVFLMAFRWGISGGMITGLLFGFYQLFTGAFIVHPVQAFLDYIVAFAVIGTAGIVATKIKKNARNDHMEHVLTYVVLGTLIGSTLRFLSHFVAGMVFFASLAENQPVWLYSLLYNGGYMLPSFIASAIVISLLLWKRPRLLLRL